MMVWLLLVPLAIALLAVAVVLYRRWQHVEAELERLSRELQTADGTTREWVKGQGDMILTVEVLNPIELARQNSRIGSQLASVAPRLVRRRVYERVADELAAELADRGVEADVKVQRLPERASR